MNLEKNQEWISNTHPHENFKIYDLIIQEWDHHPTQTFYCWERTDLDAFNEFVAKKKGMTADEFDKSNKSTYPYAWTGESQKGYLMNKIKKFNMRVLN